jgi:hypothetical protein
MPIKEMDLLGQVAHHRGIQPRAIAIVVAVHLAGIEAVTQLEETTVRAPHQFQWTAGDRLAGVREHAGQFLSAQVENRNKVTTAADTASFQTLVAALHDGPGNNYASVYQGPSFSD